MHYNIFLINKTKYKYEKLKCLTVVIYLLKQITATEEKLKLEADRIYQSTKNELENIQTIVAENNIRCVCFMCTNFLSFNVCVCVHTCLLYTSRCV